ncbi:MAG TPA: sodium/proton-translocating pyrophosphatase, partial [Nitrolancea sp.]
MSDSSTVTVALTLAIVAGALALVYGLILVRWVLALSDGNERMKEIASAIQEGASAYMRRQYQLVAIVAVVVAIILAVALDVSTAIGFLIGATASATAGFVGMSVAVRSNI